MFIIVGINPLCPSNKFVVMSDMPMQARLYSTPEDAAKHCAKMAAEYPTYDYRAHDVLAGA